MLSPVTTHSASLMKVYENYHAPRDSRLMTAVRSTMQRRRDRVEVRKADGRRVAFGLFAASR